MEEEFFSFEQFICAAIACYDIILLEEDVERLLNRIYTQMPNMVMVNDAIRFTGDYIDCYPGIYKLNSNFTLDTVGQYEDEEITLAQYFQLLAGKNLCLFMENQREKKPTVEGHHTR